MRDAAGVVPRRAASIRVKRLASCGNENRCIPKVARRAAAIWRTKSSAASRDAPTANLATCRTDAQFRVLQACLRRAPDDTVSTHLRNYRPSSRRTWQPAK